MRKRATSASLVLAVIVGGLVLAGCTNKDEPKNTTSPPATTATAGTPTKEPDPVQDNTDDAIAAYRYYVEVRNAVGQDYYNGWQDTVLPLVSGNYADWVASYYSQAADAGQHVVGADIVRSVTVAEYMEDPTGGGMERIVLHACVDSSDVQSLDADGNNRLVPGTMGRFTTTITMQHLTVFDEQGRVADDPFGQAWWRVAELDRDLDSAC